MRLRDYFKPRVRDSASDDLCLRVQALRLEPGDIVVLTSERRLPREVFERLRTMVTAAGIAPTHKIMVLEAGMDIQLLREAVE